MMDPSDERAKLIYARDFVLEAFQNGHIDRGTFVRLRDLLEARWTVLSTQEQQEAQAGEGVGGVEPRAVVPPSPPPLAAVPPTLAPAPDEVRHPAAAMAPSVATQAVPTHPQPLMPPPPAPPAPPEPLAPPRIPSVPAPARPDPRRERPRPRRDFFGIWVERAGSVRNVVASDLALHGLAYLGVLLLFAGTFGLVFFSLAGVRRDLRPLAEIAIPVVFFVSSWLLVQRRAPLVASGLQLLGGALLPVVFFASLVDGAPVPPDLTGVGLITALTATCLVLALVYAAWARRRPGSPLRYLAAPLVWTGALALGFVFKNDEPIRGLAIERPVAAQFAMAAAALPVTLVPAVWKRRHPLAAATLVAAVPGVAAVYLLTIVLEAGERWPWPPLLVAGMASIASIELLGLTFGRPRALPALEALLIGASVAGLSRPWGVGGAGLAATVAYLVLVEAENRRGDKLGVGLALAGTVAGLAMSLAAPWPTIAAFSVAAAWAHVRRQTGLRSVGGAEWLATSAAALPILVARGLVQAIPVGWAWITIASLVAAASVVVRRVRSRDAFWALWLPAAAGATAAGILVTWEAQSGTPAGLLAAGSFLAAFSLAVAPRWPAIRVWSSASAFALYLALEFHAADLRPGLQPAWWSMAGLAAVLAATLWNTRPAGHLAAIGHLASLGALAAPSSGAVRVIALAGWSAGWLCAVVSTEAQRASIVALAKRATPVFPDRYRRAARGAADLFAPLVLATSFPFLVVRAARLWGTFDSHRAWMGVALAVTALGYASAARWAAARKPLAPTLAAAAFVVSAVAVAIAAPVPWPTIEASASSIGVVALLGGELRRPAMTWFAWAMSGVLAVLLANRAGVRVDSIQLVSLGWGALLLVGGLSYDDLRAGRRRPGQGLRIDWLRYPVALGALAVPLSLAPVFAHRPSVYGWWSVAGAAFYVVIAIQLRAGAVTAVTYSLGCVGFAALLPWSPLAKPWIFALFAAGMVANSMAASKVRRETDPWLRWDLPPLVVAHAVAGVALARTADVGSFALTSGSFGALALVLALWRRNWIWEAAGTALVVAGAGAAGPGWLALALAGTSAGNWARAISQEGDVRRVRQALAVAVAGWAWAETGLWANWSAKESAIATALAAGSVAFLVGVGARFLRFPKDLTLSWGGLATAGTIVAAAMTAGHHYGVLPAVGLGLFATGAALAARPLRWRWLRHMSVAAAGWAWVETALGERWTSAQFMGRASLTSGGLALAVALAMTVTAPREAGPDPAIVRRLRGADWAFAWGALALLGQTAAALAGFHPDGTFQIHGLPPALGTGLFAAGTALAANLLDERGPHALLVGSVGWGWAEAVAGAGWTAASWMPPTAVAASALALAAAANARTPRVSRRWSYDVALLAVGGLIASCAALPLAHHRSGGLGLAAGLAVFALAAALSAQPLRRPWLRLATVALALSCGGALSYAFPGPIVTRAAGAVTAGFVAILGSMLLWWRRRESPWLRPIAMFGLASSVISIPLAASAWPNRAVLEAALFASGAEAAAAGLTLRRPAILSLSPPLVCAGFLVLVTEAFTFRTEWFTLPIGLSLLAMVEVGRWSRRIAGQHPATDDLVALELVGMATFVSAPLIDTVLRYPGFGLLGFFLGAGLMGWGGQTRVRRRVAAGSAVALLAVVLMLAGPIARQVPQFRGAALWISVAAVGAILILAATFLERGRAKVKALVRRLGELMEGWE